MTEPAIRPEPARMRDGAPLRVAIFGETYLPYLSGVTVATESLARGLAADGQQVLVVAPAGPRGESPGTAAPAATATDTAPFEVARVPSYQAPPPAPHGYRMPWPLPSRALRRAVAFQPEIVHAQSPFVSGIMARWVARRVGAPLVFTHHTRYGDYGHYLGPLGPIAASGLERYLDAYWRGCAAVVAPSNDLAAEIREQLGATRRPLVRAIPTGIDVSAIAALPEGHPRRESGWPGDSLVVASLGRVAAEKSVELVLGGFARAARAEPRLRLLFVGGGPAETSVTTAARAAGIAHRVRVTGMLPRRRALELVRASDLFAFASRTETQGLVLAEALACGVPVLAVEGPGVRDSVRDGVDGLIVPRGSASEAATALGDAIAGLATDPARRATMAASARAGASRFGSSAQIDQLVALYRAVSGRT